MTETIGIIGVGHLAANLVAGLKRDDPGLDVMLSPRNRERATDLAERFGCRIAEDNAAVVDAADTVVISTRPPDVIATLTGLPWRDGQTLISVCSGVSLADLQSAAPPATVVRTMPVVAAVLGESPTAICPDNEAAARLMSRVGSIHPVANEEVFLAACNMGPFYGWGFAVMIEAQKWLEARGVDSKTAIGLSAGMLRAAAAMAQSGHDGTPDKLLDDLATPGTLTLAGLEVLRETGGLDAWTAALDAASARGRVVAGKGTAQT
jgi:pyrroline-5-carboxylate reductase